jgi:hypothetical protein
MFEPDQLPLVRQRIREETDRTAFLLDDVEIEVESLRTARPVTIQPKNSNMISLVASDAGNNKIEFNPLLLQLVRVVDSYGAQQFFDVISSSSDTGELSKHHLAEGTPLGRLMHDLGVSELSALSPMIPRTYSGSSGWTLVYRDICEWAVIYDQCKKDFAADTVLLHDGLLRAKIFTGDLFVQMYRLIKLAIDRLKERYRRDLFLVGIAKHSEILERYRLAMSISNVFPDGAAFYVPIPMDLQSKVYKWAEYVRSPLIAPDERDIEAPKFNMGEMYFVRFGPRMGDPIWTVDILAGQSTSAQKIFGSLLNDAQCGFPIPYYPHCLQQADSHAQVVDLDLAILQDTMVEAIRDHLSPSQRPTFDAHRLAVDDPAARRYSA